MEWCQFKSQKEPTYCPGCGNANIYHAMLKALARLGIPPHKLAMVFGIGCAGNLSNNYKGYVFHGLHGRTLPVAQGIKLAQDDLTVLAFGGDGDGFGIGVGHLIHACRRNINLTYIVSDNHLYGLTTGQASPTTELEVKTKTTPEGNIEEPFNPLSMAISAGGSFVSRGYAGNPKELEDLFVQAIKHRGFSFVDVLQPCVTFNSLNTYLWYQKRVYSLAEKKYKPVDKIKALEKAEEWGEKIPIGIFYQENRLTYEEARLKKIQKGQKRIQNVEHLMKEFV